MLYKLDRSGPQPRILRVPQSEMVPDPSRRRVILFPGAGIDYTSEHNARGQASMAGSIKYMEQTLASSMRSGAEPVDVYLFTYPETFTDMRSNGSHGKTGHYAMVRERPEFHPHAHGRHAQRNTLGQVLQPLLLKRGEDWKTISPATLKQRMSRITLCGHSYGAVATQNLADALAYELKQAGWAPQDIADTMKEIVSVSVAGVGRNDYGPPSFTQFHFISSTDLSALQSIYRDKPEGVDYLALLDQCGYHRAATAMRRMGVTEPTKNVTEAVKQDILALRSGNEMPKPKWHLLPGGYSINALLPDNEIRWIERTHDGREACRVLNQAEAERLVTPVAHDYRTFLHGDHKLGEVLINVMNNATQRDAGVGDGHQLALSTPMTALQNAQRYAAHQRAATSERGIL